MQEDRKQKAGRQGRWGRMFRTEGAETQRKRFFEGVGGLGVYGC